MKILLVIDGLGAGKTVSGGTLQTVLSVIPEKQLSKSITGQNLQGAYQSPTSRTYTIATGYEGADSYLGHFEMMGVPAYFKTVYVEQWQKEIMNLFGPGQFTQWGYHNGDVLISNNIEAELGSTINVITSPNLYRQMETKAELLRRYTDANRLIVMTSDKVKVRDEQWVQSGISNKPLDTNQKVYGLIPARLGMYDESYQCTHLGRGFQEYDLSLRESSYLYALMQANRPFCMIGKVCDIFQIYKSASHAKLFNVVDALDVAHQIKNELVERQSEFVFANFQTFDLQCHARDIQQAAKELVRITSAIDDIMNYIHEDDTLVITADHGNNPASEGNGHTVEDVPLILQQSNHGTQHKLHRLRDINTLLLKES